MFFLKTVHVFFPPNLDKPLLLGALVVLVKLQDACARSFHCQRFTYYIDSKAPADELVEFSGPCGEVEIFERKEPPNPLLLESFCKEF